jgi:RND family efflux transporter MFP subunit
MPPRLLEPFMSEHFSTDQFLDAEDKGGNIPKVKRIAIGVALVALVLAALGIGSRFLSQRHLADNVDQAVVPTVQYVLPQGGSSTSELNLPGNIQAWNSAAIYARTNGYLREWLADIGQKVRAGQPLAILDAPDLDPQLEQAKADYQTTLAQQALAGTTAKRWTTLLKSDAVSQQEADEKAGDYKAKIAVANASLANVKRLRALEGFTRLRAPFAGTVTSRTAQIGALVVSGNSAALPLFTVSDVHRIRVYVRVPQSYSAQLHNGMHAKLTIPEYPQRSFDAVMTKSSGAVDNSSGAVLVELQLDNPDEVLKPGAFAQVSFPLGSAGGTVRIPSSALIFAANGTTVAVVDGDGRVAIKPVTIARDLGKQLEIASGLKPTDRVLDSPPDAIQAGDLVHAVAQPREAAGAPHVGH